MFSSRDNRLHARYINGIPVGEWLMQQPEWVEVFERIKPTYLGMTVTCRYNGYDESTSTYYTRRSTVVDVDMGAHGNGVWLVVASREFGKLVRLPGYAIVEGIDLLRLTSTIWIESVELGTYYVRNYM